MKTLFMALGLSLLVGVGANAHQSLVTIKHADKVIVKGGGNHHKGMCMMKCLQALKKYPNAEEATKAAMEKITKHCEMLGLNEKHCTFKKHKVAHGLYHCFAKAAFVREFLGTAAPAAPMMAPAK